MINISQLSAIDIKNFLLWVKNNPQLPRVDPHFQRTAIASCFHLFLFACFSRQPGFHPRLRVGMLSLELLYPQAWQKSGSKKRKKVWIASRHALLAVAMTGQAFITNCSGRLLKNAGAVIARSAATRQSR